MHDSKTFNNVFYALKEDLIYATEFKIQEMVKADRSKPVTSHPTPKNEQSQKQSANVIARGMYRIKKSETQTPDSKSNIHVSNSTGVESSNSVRRPKSKGTKSKNRVLKNTNSSSAYVRKISHSVNIDSNICETKDSNVCQTNASVSNSKTVNAVNDGSNIVCVSCGIDVFLLSHEKCVARYALSRNSNVKRALFTTPVAAKSKNLGTTFVVAKSRLSVANTPKATNKVFSASSLSHDSSQSKTLSNYMKNKITTSQKWQRWFEYQQSCIWSPKSKTAQSLPSKRKSRIRVRSTSNTTVTTQKWVAKLSTVPSVLVSCDAGDSARPLDFRFGNDHFAAITGYGDYVQGNITICHMAASSPVCLMSRATSTKSWLWHRRLSHLNFGTINQLTLKDLVDGLLKFKYNKDHLCSACEQGIVHKTSIARTPQQNGVFECQNRTLVEAARTMLIFSKAPEFLWAEAIATACFTQNRSIVHTRGFRIYNRQTKKIMDTIHVKFDELTTMAFECNNLEPGMNCMNFHDSSEDSLSVPLKSDLDNLFGSLYEEYYETSSPEVLDNSAANTLDNEHTSSSSSIITEEDEAPQIVSLSAE
ncbi:retrovirus-related pol polyprotein from transposon TNT 1-94 [Tanacetum coccineum]